MSITITLPRTLSAWMDRELAAEAERVQHKKDEAIQEAKTLEACWAQLDAVLDQQTPTDVAKAHTECPCWTPTTDPWTGYTCCTQCGWQPASQLVTELSYEDTQRTHSVRKQPYQPLIYFREHLRRYLGGQRKVVPPALFKVFGNWKPCRHLYFRIARVLSHYRVHKWYKWIYPIIYQVLRVPRPKLSPVQFRGILHDYMGLQYYFRFHRCGRHSMPSHFVCLDYLLHRHHHVPAFVLPRLKSSVRQQRLYSHIAALEQYKYPPPTATQ